MDTKEAAAALGTNPRRLRIFLRSGYSTFVPVGSGARYDFTAKEMPTLAKRFSEWSSAETKSVGTPAPKKPRTTPKPDVQRAKDRRVWDQEGDVVLPDIRDPRVRARVRADAEAAENRLATLLVSKGMHVLQGYTTTGKRAS